MKEPKLKTVYVCSNCGETSPRWMGRCPSCGSWNTMNEDVVAEAPKAGTAAAKQAAAARPEGVTTLTAKRLSEISMTEEKKPYSDRHFGAGPCTWRRHCAGRRCAFER